MVDLLGGRLALLVLPEGLLRQHHDSARLRVLATSGRGRSTELSAVPAFSEQGWTGIGNARMGCVFQTGGKICGTG